MEGEGGVVPGAAVVVCSVRRALGRLVLFHALTLVLRFERPYSERGNILV